MKQVAMFVSMTALASVAAFGQTPKSVRWTGPGDGFEQPAQDEPAGLQRIFSNLGTSAAAAYGSGAWYLSGPASTNGQEFVGMAFTPKSASHASRLRAAIQYVAGANQITLGLYSDNSGAPGTLLASGIATNLPVFFACCKLAEVTISNTALTAGVQYWVIASTPASGTGADFLGMWNWVPQLKLMQAIQLGGAWLPLPAYIEEPAGAVYGSIP